VNTLKRGAVAVLILPAIAATVSAQDLDPFGAREPVRLLADVAVPDSIMQIFGIVGTTPRRKIEFTLNPAFSAANGVNQYGASLAMATPLFNTSLPIQFRYTHRVLDLESTQRNRAQGDVKLTLSRPDALFRVIVGAQHIAVSDVSSRQDVSLAFETPLRRGCTSNCFSVAATAWAGRLKPNGGPWANGSTLATGLILRPTQENEISADYRFKSDVLGGEDFSVSFRQKLKTLSGEPTLVVTGARLRVLSVGAIVRF
jgi:hypothetical protein